MSVSPENPGWKMHHQLVGDRTRPADLSGSSAGLTQTPKFLGKIVALDLEIAPRNLDEETGFLATPLRKSCRDMHTLAGANAPRNPVSQIVVRKSRSS
ncbi:hypothetical protein [Microseira sp. BLCC-F43]|jgi:hypothetical protein|uniref:hypothetical protein n=1 Tax=Microseira sp. BLCC-F43 TaxID=3153602 RepID=UPI0035B95ECD